MAYAICEAENKIIFIVSMKSKSNFAYCGLFANSGKLTWEKNHPEKITNRTT